MSFFSIVFGFSKEATGEKRVFFSLLDVLSESGGIILSLMGLFRPIATIFSDFYFKIGVLSLLFKARSARRVDELELRAPDLSKDWVDPKEIRATKQGRKLKYEKVFFSERQKLQLFF